MQLSQDKPSEKGKKWDSLRSSYEFIWSWHIFIWWITNFSVNKYSRSRLLDPIFVIFNYTTRTLVNQLYHWSKRVMMKKKKRVSGSSLTPIQTVSVYHSSNLQNKIQSEWLQQFKIMWRCQIMRLCNIFLAFFGIMVLVHLLHLWQR